MKGSRIEVRSLAEVLGVLGLIASLIFVAFEIR